MAGIGSRFMDYGFTKNKYLLPLDIVCTPMIEKAILSLNISVPCKYLFIIREEHGEDTEIRNILKEICMRNKLTYDITSVSYLTEGPAATVASAINMIDLESPLIVSNSDQVLDWNFNDFLNTCKNYQGCVLTYQPNYPLKIGDKDKHSFIKLDDNNNIIQVAEKIVLSEQALVGVHYYKKSKYFIDAYHYLVKNNIRAPNGEFYLSLTYQAMLENKLNIGYYQLDAVNGHFYPVGEPDDYINYLYTQGKYINNNQIISSFPYTLYDKDIVKITYNYDKKGIEIINKGFIILLKSNIVTTKDIITIEDTYYISIEYTHHYSKTHTWNITDFIRGWIIGNFIPSIIETDAFELGILKHKKDEKWPFHYHSYMTEINLLLDGEMILNNKKIIKNELFIIDKNQIACPFFLTDVTVLCIKTPSVKNDKICL